MTRTLALALTAFLLASCGSWGEAGDSDATLAARGRASLVATFTDTPWRLPPMHNSDCENQRQSSRTSRDADGLFEDAIFCSLDDSAMAHLLRRLDQGLGTGVTATQKTCIHRKVTRDQIAELLAAPEADADDRAATVARFDDELASAIRRCTRG